MNKNIHWQDLPSDDYTAILGCSSSEVLILNDKIANYNKLGKNQYYTLSQRIIELSSIEAFLSDWINSTEVKTVKNKHLFILQQIANAKRNYLEQIKIIYEIKDIYDYLSNYHHDLTELEDNSKLPIFLHSNRIYSIKKREYWGDFWIVTLDPCHRQLTPYLQIWESITKGDKKNLGHFFLWLETQYIPLNTSYECYFLQEEKLNNTELIVKKGLLYSKTSDVEILGLFKRRQTIFICDRSKKAIVGCRREPNYVSFLFLFW